MKTSINGKPGDWSDATTRLWHSKAGIRAEGVTTVANYFTPRPAVDVYNRGSNREGFTYTIGGQVYQMSWVSTT